MDNSRYVLEGIIGKNGDESCLIGGRCKKCGVYSFPATEFCLECLSDEIEAVPLSSTGTLYSYTITRMNVGHFKAPHLLGMIDLPEGVRVVAPLKDDEEYQVGDEVKLIVTALWTEDDGTEVIGYRFGHS